MNHGHEYLGRLERLVGFERVPAPIHLAAAEVIAGSPGRYLNLPSGEVAPGHHS